MNDLSSRPSSWPVRRERRHYAINANHNEVMEALSSMKEALNDKIGSPAFYPPGLTTPAQLVNTMLDQQTKLIVKIHNIAEQMDQLCLRTAAIESNIEESPLLDTNLQHRIEAMELLLFRTSLADFEEIDRRIKAVSMDNVESKRYLSSHAPAKVQPEPEESPCKARMENMPLWEEQAGNIHALSSPTPTQLFTIYDEFDKQYIEAASQTEIYQNEKPQLLNAIIQTSPFKHCRKGRVNGRATQTMHRVSEAATDTNVDRFECEEAVLIRLAQSQDEMSKCDDVKIPPCIVNEAFVNAVMAGMEQVMDAQLASICK